MNIKMQCCGVILLVVIFGFYLYQKKIKVNTEKAFLRMFIFETISLLLDIISMVFLKYDAVLPGWAVDFVCKSYAASLVAFAFNGLRYVCADIYIQKAQFRKWTYLYGVTAGIGIILVYLLPIYKNLEDEQNAFTYGPSIITTYIFCMGFLAVIIYLTIKYRKQMNQRRRDAVWGWIGLWLTAAMVQFFNNKLLLVGYASAISILIIYLYLENPEMNIDRKTGLFNASAFKEYVRQILGTEEDYSILDLRVRIPFVNNDIEEDSAIWMELVYYLSSIMHVVVFRGAEDEIILVMKRTYLDTVVKRVEERLDSGWGSEQEVPVQASLIVMPNIHIVNQVDDILPCLQYVKQNNMEYAEFGKVILDEDITSQMYEEHLVEQLITDAMNNDWVQVYYQPIYSTEEKRFVSAEALCRIVDSEGKLVPPGLFIDIAEKNGMILKLGEIVFRKVCQFISRNDMDTLGLDYIEVNLSTVQGSYEFLADNFIAIMEQYKVDPAKINLEITESGSIGARKLLLNNMQKLIEYGVSFSLDDFGTGQSNLNYIVDMPVEIVKFDRSMIVSYFENGKAKYVMDAAMHMIQGMKLKIVSEGIETKDQLETMKTLGVHYIQGFYFSKPIPLQEFIVFIKQHRQKQING